jgi:hypothetical protein
MFYLKPGSTRWRLGFKWAVLKNFLFLSRYGFLCVHAETTLVRYVKLWPFWGRGLFVNVYHGRGSYEMGVEIGPRNRNVAAVGLAEILEWAEAKEAEEFRKHVMFQTSSREGVQRLVPQMADLIRRYGAPFLRGDKRAFSGIEEERRQSSALARRHMELKRAREKGEIAWAAKDYEQVLSIYEPVQRDLTQSERMRLDYARKRAAHSAKAVD